MTTKSTNPYFILTGRFHDPDRQPAPDTYPRELIFGDYERETVEDEQLEYRDHHNEYFALRIHRLPDDKQSTIDAAVASKMAGKKLGGFI